MLSDCSDKTYKEKQNYEVLVARYLTERAVLFKSLSMLRQNGMVRLVIMQARSSAH